MAARLRNEDSVRRAIKAAHAFGRVHPELRADIVAPSLPVEQPKRPVGRPRKK